MHATPEKHATPKIRHAAHHDAATTNPCLCGRWFATPQELAEHVSG